MPHDTGSIIASCGLPVASVLPSLSDELENGRRAVLVAPPGAGKTTLVPLALLGAPWLSGLKVVMLEPRRLAARAAARRMARMLGEEVGETVGYRMRLDSRIGPRTRIEVVTEGILARMLLDDPELADVGCVVFDEYHERSLQADLGLALCLDVSDALRDDLRLLVMSATLDAVGVAELLGGCPVIECTGRVWPVEVRHVPPRRAMRGGYPPAIEDEAAACVRRALTEEQGGILVFLPGSGEIRRTAARLEGLSAQGVEVHPLHGDLSADRQDAAIAPAREGTRKVVLASSIAETSITIEGIRVVIDAGLARVARFDQRSGMSRLITERVSLATATQRAGRAGRTAPGVCYRLWSQQDDATLRPFARPEILEADLAPLLLQLAAWGVAGPDSLRWLDTPPPGNVIQARTLLQDLDALDAAGRITRHGRAMAGLPLHPRLAHMVWRADEREAAGLACLVAALLEERDAQRGEGCDLRSRLDRAVAHLRRTPRGGGHEPAGGDGASRDSYRRIVATARRIAALAGRRLERLPLGYGEACGELVALAYPDRVAMAQGGGMFRLRSGKGAFLPPEDPLADEAFLAIAELDGDPVRARIWRAAPLSREAIEDLFADAMHERRNVGWDARLGAVMAQDERRLGNLVLEARPVEDAEDDDIRAAVLAGIRALGLGCLPWTAELRQWQARVMLMRGERPRRAAKGDSAGHGRTMKGEMSDVVGKGEMPSAHEGRLAAASPADGMSSLTVGDEEGWPDVSDANLEVMLEDWLGLFLTGVRRREHFSRIPLAEALHALLPWHLSRILDEKAPTHIVVPSGSRVLIDYLPEGGPVLAVKLQELFGMLDTPRVGDGVAVVVHLLSPAGRSLQVTSDLAGFWRTGYPAVRAEMRGRYPKHPWPEDPLDAVATRHTKKRAGL